MKRFGFFSSITLLLIVMFSLNVSAYTKEFGTVVETDEYKVLVDTDFSYTLTEPGGLFSSRVVTLSDVTSTVMFKDKLSIVVIDHPELTKIRQDYFVTFNGTGTTYINGDYDDDNTYKRTAIYDNYGFALGLDENQTYTGQISIDSIRGKRYKITSITTGTNAAFTIDAGIIPVLSSNNYSDGL